MKISTLILYKYYHYEKPKLRGNNVSVYIYPIKKKITMILPPNLGKNVWCRSYILGFIVISNNKSCIENQIALKLYRL